MAGAYGPSPEKYDCGDLHVKRDGIFLLPGASAACNQKLHPNPDRRSSTVVAYQLPGWRPHRDESRAYPRPARFNHDLEASWGHPKIGYGLDTATSGPTCSPGVPSARH